MILGEKLTKYMDDNDLSFNSLARNVLKMSYGVVASIINDDIYSAKTATKIADAIGDEYRQYIIPNQCCYCGKEFIGQLHGRYCSMKCNQKYLSCLKAGEALPKSENTKHRSKNFKRVSEVNHEARAMNKTYGQRVAMERLSQGR